MKAIRLIRLWYKIRPFQSYLFTKYDHFNRIKFRKRSNWYDCDTKYDHFNRICLPSTTISIVSNFENDQIDTIVIQNTTNSIVSDYQIRPFQLYRISKTIRLIWLWYKIPMGLLVFVFRCFVFGLFGMLFFLYGWCDEQAKVT